MKMAASFDVVHTLPVHCPSSCEYCASGGPPMCSLEGRKRHLVGEISNGVCKKNKVIDSRSLNPLQVLGDTVFQHVLSCLDAETLARCLVVCNRWKTVAEEDFLWDAHCKELWEGKLHILPQALNSDIPRCKAYQMSIEESNRTNITVQDLCGHVWEFWFKKGAGEYWCASDPYWHGLPAMHRYFHMDGSVSADPEDPIWGGHECSWTLSKRNKHASVRINHWPPLVTTRTSSWGWRLENCWVIYQSTAAQNTR